MFKFFKRVSTVVGSELNSMLDKAEDPVKMLDQYMREMAEDIRESETSVAKMIANEKLLKKKHEEADKMVQKRADQAVKALEAGNEDLARRALEDKKTQSSQAESFKESYDRSKADADALRAKLDEMKQEYSEMKLKKDQLKARAESAKTRTKMNRSMSDIGDGQSSQGFDRMEEKVMQLEAEAETSDDMSSSSKSLDDELDSLGSNDVDDELAALKKKISKDE